MTLANQFYVYLPVNACLEQCLNSESASMCFQPGVGASFDIVKFQFSRRIVFSSNHHTAHLAGDTLTQPADTWELPWTPILVKQCPS